MQPCKFAITTSIDEQENSVTYVGTINACEEGIHLAYKDGEANVSITLQKGVVIIDRQGDYALHMRLEEGKKTESLLSIGGSQGSVLTQTHYVKYALEGNRFRLSLRYDLIFSEAEIQKTKLNLKGQIRNR